MYTNRSFAKVLLLTLITCGIYGLIFTNSLIKDINKMLPVGEQPLPGIGRFILFSILTCGIYGLYFWYIVGEKMVVVGATYGVEVKLNGTLTLVILLLGSLACGLGSFILMYMQVQTMNQLSNAYNHRL